VTTSEDVREELGGIAPARRCDRLAEISGLFHAAGTLRLRAGGAWALQLDLGSGAAARRAFALLREEGIATDIRTYRRRAFDRATRYQLHVEGNAHALRALVAAGVVDRNHAPLEQPPRRVVARRCCRGAYHRGAFLGAGSLSLRQTPHLEVRVGSREAADFIRSLASELGARMAVAERQTHAAAYAKSWEAIESLLIAMGAAEAALALEERAVVAATRGAANRRANADHANLVRTGRAAEAQLAAIETLRRDGLLEQLPDELREAAELRRRHPAESLRELAGRADPPASPAALHRRLRRLEELSRRPQRAGRRRTPG
jgi:DNA-binding protein WhiA